MNYPAYLNPFLDGDDDDTASFYSAASCGLVHGGGSAVQATADLVRGGAVLQRHRRPRQDVAEEGSALGSDSGHRAALLQAEGSPARQPPADLLPAGGA